MNMFQNNVLKIVLLLSTALSTAKCVLQVTWMSDPSETDYFKFNMLTDIRPNQYYIDIRLDENPDFQFYNATTEINFRSNVNSNFMAFHLKLWNHLELHEITLHNLNSTRAVTNFNVTHFYDKFDPLVGLQASRNFKLLERNVFYRLSVRHSVKFIENGEKSGLFKSCPTMDVTSERNCFVTTYFETYHIRKSFPSFDNATLKAHFNIKVTYPSGMTAISNMPVKSIVHSDRVTTTTTFEETPLMSTYLLGITIGKFEKTPIENVRNISMNVYTPIGSKKPTIVQKYAGRFLQSIELYLNKRYTLPKLDFFVSYAANVYVAGNENWGLINLDASRVMDANDLPDPKYTDNVLNLIAHEIVHQFVGNLVSLKEIRSKWLKEGITTYLTVHVLDAVFPNENYIDRLLTDNLAIAMLVEVLAKPIVLNDYAIDKTPFKNHVIYSKGAAITSMIQHVIGDENFRSVMHNIFNRFEFGTMSTNDFCAELRSANILHRHIPEDIDIELFVDTWINQPEFPIVTVTRNYELGKVELRQNNAAQNKIWWIPFNYATSSMPHFGSTTPNGWLRHELSMEIVVPNLKPNDWIVFNKHATGYYLVNYDELNWNLLGNLLSSDEFHVIPAINRAKLICDAALLNVMHLVSDDILFKILNLLKREHSYAVWAIVNNYQHVSSSFDSYLRDNVNELLGHAYAYYGPVLRDNDTTTMQITRSTILEIACKHNYRKCHRDMERLATSFANQPDTNAVFKYDLKLFEMICQYGIKSDDNFEKIITKVHQSQNRHVQKIFYNSFDERTNLTAFKKYFVASIYNLPLPNDDQLKFNAELVDIQKFNDIDMLNSCMRVNCYDYISIFQNEADRFETIFATVEIGLLHMIQSRFIYENGATIHELLRTIDTIYGGDVSDRIKAKYDIDSPRFNNGRNSCAK